MGNFQHEPVMLPQTHVGYVEGYLDALEKVQEFQKRHPMMSLRDICFAMKINLRTTILAGGMIRIPQDLTSFPSVAHLLQQPEA